MLVTTGAGARYNVDSLREIGGGAEGKVYVLSSAFCLKVFDQSARGKKHAKLKYMLGNPIPRSPFPTARVTWPTDLAYENRSFVGYVMPFVNNGKPLEELVRQRDLQATLQPDIDPLAFRLTVARNLAAVIEHLHAQECLVGDIKLQNFMVLPEGTVFLVDSDSLQLRNRHTGQVYVNLYTSEGYKSPEYFQTKYTGATAVQDYWALATLIFQLLTGWHPFDAVGARYTLRDERAAHGLYPYTQSPREGVQPPPAAPPIGNLPDSVRERFEDCFVAGFSRPFARPTATDWGAALAEAHRHVKVGRCGHYYFDHLQACPYCKMGTGKPVNRPPEPESHCWKCGQLYPDRLQSCPHCHAQSNVVCPNCGASYPRTTDRAYCDQCSTALPPFRTCPNPHCKQPGRLIPARATYCPYCRTRL